jgi:hypothetical protein
MIAFVKHHLSFIVKALNYLNFSKHCRLTLRFLVLCELHFRAVPCFRTFYSFTTLSRCNSFSGRDTLSTTLSALTHNDPAAWRSGGFHKCLCGVQSFNYARHFPRGYCRRCAKPQVVNSAFCPLLGSFQSLSIPLCQ